MTSLTPVKLTILPSNVCGEVSCVPHAALVRLMQLKNTWLLTDDELGVIGDKRYQLIGNVQPIPRLVVVLFMGA